MAVFLAFFKRRVCSINAVAKQTKEKNQARYDSVIDSYLFL